MAGYSKYDAVAAKAIRQLHKPVKYTFDVVEHDDFTELRVYKDELLAMNSVDQSGVFAHLADCKVLLESMGLRIWINGVDGSPPQPKRK